MSLFKRLILTKMKCRYRTYGDPPAQRSAEDLAFSVARFFAKNGTLTNYYMVIFFML